ncbi:helix-turn-helix domain-containing protein [Streptomyces sp. NPDC052299]|uniref:helix-turn-helix domain-containing protein n=1 Tax=Streptomyces sp. NPDC052299 TaxID=3155054 RepID=UPI00343322DA
MASSHTRTNSTPADVPLPRLYRPEDVATVLGCSAWWVKDRARRRLIPFVRVGRAYRFSGEHLAEIILMNEEGPDRSSQHSRSTPAPAAKHQPRQQADEATPTARLRARPPRRTRPDQFGTAA